ncbi:MAG: Hsp20/alpha crystallin family protein [Candidatus Aureabacteria bacterium]|nr:Hsp20/alpha crystallin family protein [Candidatus Auribacterota bacterium]
MSAQLLLGTFRELERRILRSLWGEESSGPVFTEIHFEPCIDVFETREGTVVKMEIPGMKKRDITVELEGDTLVIRGRRDDKSRGAKVSYQQMEIDYGTFERRVTVRTPIKKDAVSACYRDGFLEVWLPTRRPLRGKRGQPG